MTRLSAFDSPLLLGFDRLEHVLDRLSKSANEGYPPYNIVQLGEDRLRIMLAVAGFAVNDLSVTVEQNQLMIRGQQEDDPSTVYLHRGIATRQFQRVFLLAQEIEVTGAELDNGLLLIDLARPVPEERTRTIAIKAPSPGRKAKTPVSMKRESDSQPETGTSAVGGGTRR